MANTQTPSKDGNQSWESRINNIIAEREPLTDIPGQAGLKKSKQNYFDVYAVTPDKETPDETYPLAGNQTQLAGNISLFLALYNALGGKRQADISEADFLKWVAQIESGFEDFKGKSPRLQMAATPYGEDKSARPRVVLLEGKKSFPFKAVEFWPNRSILSESYIISGTFAQIIQQLSELFANFQRLALYDWGAWVGYPIPEYLRQQPREGLALKILLAAEKEPPIKRIRFGDAGFEYRIRPREVLVPFPRKELLSYANLRQICGGSNGLDWGHWSARAYISISPDRKSKKSLSQMVAGGPTQAEAARNLDRFLALTEGVVVGRSETEIDLEEGTRADNQRNKYLKRFNVYPYIVSVLNTELNALSSQKGQPALTARAERRRERLDIWREKEPSDWAANLRDAIASPKAGRL